MLRDYSKPESVVHQTQKEREFFIVFYEKRTSILPSRAFGLIFRMLPFSPDGQVISAMVASSDCLC
jgi:Ca2+-binding EF-hand superfamily protein